MNIELIDNRIRATWPRYPKATHDEIIRRLKSIGAEFDKESRCWWIEPSKADRLLDLFPKAAFDYEMICAATQAEARRGRVFYEFLVSAGVELVCDAHGAVCAVGDNVSPLLQEEVQRRFGNGKVAEMVQGRLI